MKAINLNEAAACEVLSLQNDEPRVNWYLAQICRLYALVLDDAETSNFPIDRDMLAALTDITDLISNLAKIEG